MHLEIAVSSEKESLTDIFTIIIYLSSYLDCYFNVMSWYDDISTDAGASTSKSTVRVNGLASAVLRDKDFEKVRSNGFSVASDPKASEVYKSLFDTHKTAQKKQSAHWVTCNPQYF